MKIRLGRKRKPIRTRLKDRWQKLTQRARNVILIFTIGSFLLAAIRLWLEWRNR